MRGSPVNRLESVWPKLSEADAPEKETTWGQTAKSWEHNLESFMTEHPKLTVAAAAALGLVLGWMVKRK
jgi:ElaB/YqjD/DUF883 family membrane-anchored ribosome-binding protein